MKTKEEYKNALDRMEKAYFDLDNSLSAMDSFNKDIHLFADLINDLFANVINKHYEEKQEIKQETNFEHFKEEITKLDFSFAVRNGKAVPCEDCPCKECYFKRDVAGCNKFKIKWLYEQYEKKYKLNQFE